MFDDLSRECSDVVFLNDGSTVREYPLSFRPGGVQRCLPLFR
jgi:hypothetical protein